MSQHMLQTTNELLKVFKQMVKGQYAFCLAGSYATNESDDFSDIDVFIYTEDMIDRETRLNLLKNVLEAKNIYVTESIDKQPWGGSMDFCYNNFQIETSIRSLSDVEKVFNNVFHGNINVIPVVWTPNGYYEYVCLSEIYFNNILEDPFDLVAEWKNRLVPYPAILKRGIISRFWGNAKFWMHNIHYINAIKRADIVYTSSIVNQTFHNIVQVLFAINETYFIGDKRLDKKISSLLWVPEIFRENIDILCNSLRNVDHLELQRNILLNTTKEIERKLLCN